MEQLLGILLVFLPPTLAFEPLQLQALVRSECLVITNSPFWLYDGPIIRVERPNVLKGWENSLGTTFGTLCLDFVYFGPWDIAQLEPWKGTYQNYSIINVVERGQDIVKPKVGQEIKYLEQGHVHLYCPNHGYQFNVTIFSQNILIRPVPICPNALSGQHLNISVVGLSPPNAIFNTQGEIVGGVSLDVFNIMANKLEFTYTLKTEYSWGDPIPNSKEWNGVVGAVKNGTSPIGVGSIFVDYNYNQVVDYLDPLLFYPVGLRSKKPSRLQGYTNLVRPFSFLVWLIILVSVLIITMVMVGIKYFEGVKRAKDLAHHCFLVIRILFSQSGDLSAHNGRSSKMFVGFWIMTALFLSSMYECNLRAYLMFTSYEKPIETEQDIVDRGMDLYLAFGTPFLDYYKESDMAIRRQFWSKAESNPDLIYHAGNAESLLEHEKSHLLEKNGVDLISPAFFLGRYPIMKANFGYEPFYLSKRRMFELQFSFILEKYKDYRKDLNWIVRQLHASGILIALPNRYFHLEALIGEIPDNSPKPFSMEHFVGAFVILGLGLVLSGLAFVKERHYTT